MDTTLQQPIKKTRREAKRRRQKGDGSIVERHNRGASATNVVAPSPIHVKPYRVLLVVERGSDPYGLVVSREADKFQPVAAFEGF